MNWILDIALIVVAVIALIVGIKRGFARSALELVAFFLTVFLAFQIATPLATACYDNLVAPRVAKKIEETLNTKTDTGGKPLAVITESIPSIVKPYVEKHAQEITSAFDQIKRSVPSNTELGIKLQEQVLRPLAIKAFSAVFFFVVAIVLGLFLHFLAIVISKAFELPIIGAVNATLGGLVGILRGAVYVFLLALLLLFLANQFGGQLAELVASSKIIAFLQSHLSSLMSF